MSVFDTYWFRQHQRKLRWLCNSPVTRDWFRHLLRIDRDHPVDHPIVEIAPQHIILHNGGNEFTLDTRCGPKFANRLYHGLLPAWWTMHSFDMIANRYRPAWNLGFDTLTAYPDAHPESTTCDGTIGIGSNGAWSTLMNSNYNGGYDDAEYMWTGMTLTTSPNYYNLYKCITLFDTSVLTAGATISAAIYKLYGRDNGAGWGDQLNVDPGFTVVSTIQISPATSIGGYSSVLFKNATGTSALSDTITHPNIVNDYNTWTLNTDGKAALNKTGVSFLGCVIEPLRTQLDPSWFRTAGGVEGYYFQTSENTGTSQDPILQVTYTLPSTWIPQVMII